MPHETLSSVQSLAVILSGSFSIKTSWEVGGEKNPCVIFRYFVHGKSFFSPHVNIFFFLSESNTTIIVTNVIRCFLQMKQTMSPILLSNPFENTSLLLMARCSSSVNGVFKWHVLSNALDVAFPHSLKCSLWTASVIQGHWPISDSSSMSVRFLERASRSKCKSAWSVKSIMRREWHSVVHLLVLINSAFYLNRLKRVDHTAVKCKPLSLPISFRCLCVIWMFEQQPWSPNTKQHSVHALYPVQPLVDT